MQKLLIIVYVLCAAVFFLPLDSAAMTDDATLEDELEEVSEESIPVASSDQQIREAMDIYREEKGISWGTPNEKGHSYYQARQTVAVSPESRDWGKHRVAAFDRAVLAAQREFVRDTYGKTTTETLQKYFRDDSSNREEFPEDEVSSSWGRLLEKVKALGEAELDAKLEEAGVDPGEFLALGPKQKKCLFLDRLVQVNTTKARGQVAGFVPIRTFEGVDDRGDHTVGVVLKYSPALRDIAASIAAKQIPFSSSSKEGKALDDVLPSNREGKALSSEFGVRVMRNEKGQPVVVSFGQWATSYAGSDGRKRARAEQHAERQAMASANAAISDFLNASLVLSEEAERSSEESECLEKSVDFVETSDVAVVIDRVNEETKRRSKMDLAGTKTIRNWSYTHPYGPSLVGVVRAWTPSGLESAQAVKNYKPKSLKGSGEDDRNQGASMPAGVTAGGDYMDEDDF